MNVDKVQKIIVKIAKSGNKELLRDLSELFAELGEYEAKGQRQAPKQMEENYSVSSHASNILDGGSYSLFTPKDSPNERSMSAPPAGNPYTALQSFSTSPSTQYQQSDIPYVPGSSRLESRPEVSSHADLLL